jgi:hypothetical protein
MRRSSFRSKTLRWLAAGAVCVGAANWQEVDSHWAVASDAAKPTVKPTADQLSDQIAEPTAEQVAFFERKIRPVLVEHCLACHSQQAEANGKLKGGLRLDSAAGWKIGGDSGPAIVPGKPGESELLAALRYESYEMPPKGKLPDAVIADFEKWIADGAIDPRAGKDPREDATASGSAKKTIDLEAGRKHWAYQPPRMPPLPEVKQPLAAAGRIDRHLLVKLDAANLTPAAPVDRATLARRVYFDLVGLPPAPEEVDAFVADTAPDAYERLVDRLLASPRFGERWGRHWLDVARFAESLTLRGFILKDAWRYRNYVIEALNDDRPYDQFVREQIAGDLMAADPLAAAKPDSVAERRRQITATGFLALGNTNLEEQDKKQLDMDVVDEQLDVIGKAILAQTISCARCHDHKFDPIPTRDYYALAGILRGSKMLEHANVSQWMEVPLPVEPAEQARLDAHNAVVAALESRLGKAKERLAKLTAAATSQAKVTPVEKLAGIVVDDTQAKRVGTWQTSTHTKAFIGDGYLHDQDAGKGEKTLTFAPNLPKPGKYEVRIAFVAGGNRAASVPVTVFSADGERTIHVNQQAPPPVAGHFVTLGQFSFEKTDQSFVLVANEGTKGHVIADAVQFIAVEELAADKPEAGAGAAKAPAKVPADVLADVLADDAMEVARMEAELTRLRQTGPQRETAISLVDAGRAVDLPIHIRGSVHTLGEIAPRGFLQVATDGSPPKLPADASGRRQLADWLASRENPLAARVMANRVWHWLFGAGLVRTVDNFGTTGETPSHPELLDELALSLADDGWSVKQLIRRIVTSRAYQASSAVAGEAGDQILAADPENRLLAHANRRRLDAECLRDAMLAVSGELRLEAEGSTFPAKLTADYAYRHDLERDSRLGGGFERSVYVPVFRNAMSDVLAAFDAAADQLLAQSEAATCERVEHAYRMTLGRSPTAAEADVLVRFVDGELKSDAAAGERGRDRQVWRQVFATLFASVDFRYVD